MRRSPRARDRTRTKGSGSDGRFSARWTGRRAFANLPDATPTTALGGSSRFELRAELLVRAPVQSTGPTLTEPNAVAFVDDTKIRRDRQGLRYSDDLRRRGRQWVIGLHPAWYG
jgi:hypothetical protein